MHCTAQVHRFGPKVAMYLGPIGTGTTVYLSPNAAIELAAAIRRTAKECKSVPFTESTVGTYRLQFSGEPS